MWIDGIVLALLIYFVASGARRGALASFLRLFTLIAGYALAYLLGPILGPLVDLGLDLGSFLSGVLAAAIVFVLCLIGLGLVASAVRRSREPSRMQTRTGADRAGGALLGVVQAVLLAMLLGVLARWIEVGQQNGALTRLPAAGSSQVARATEQVVQGTADAVLDEDDRMARLGVRFAVRPGEAVQDARAVLEHPAFVSLQYDALFWSYLSSGAIDQALNSRSFLALTQDDALRGRLAELGIIGSAAAEDPSQLKAEARALFVELAPRIKALRTDPAMAELARDPAVAQALQSGDTFSLLRDPRVIALVDRVLDPPDS